MKQGDCRDLGKSHKCLNQGHSRGNRMKGKKKSKFQCYLNVNLTGLDDQFTGEEVGMVDEGFPSEYLEATVLKGGLRCLLSVLGPARDPESLGAGRVWAMMSFTQGVWLQPVWG